MIDCTHRRATTEPRLFVCSNPNVNAANDVVWVGVCDGCPQADGGCQTVEPKRLKNETRGLGDSIADIMAKIPFKRKRSCVRCTKRQRGLNKLFPYHQPKAVKLSDSGGKSGYQPIRITAGVAGRAIAKDPELG